MTRYDITLKKEPPRVEGLSNSRHCLLSNGCSHYYESDAGHCSRCWHRAQKEWEHNLRKFKT
jgi:hypothetical protein